MNRKRRRASWWQVFALVPIMLVLLIGESQLAIPQWAHTIVEIAIVLLTFGEMLLWIRANETALWNESLGEDDWEALKVTVYEPKQKGIYSLPSENPTASTQVEPNVHPKLLARRSRQSVWRVTRRAKQARSGIDNYTDKTRNN